MLNKLAAVSIMALALTIPRMAVASDREDDVKRTHKSAEVFKQIMDTPDKGIPQDLMNKARCVVVVPGMKKAGFIVGAKYGRGFAVCRREGGAGWSAPAAMRVEGGSVGIQAAQVAQAFLVARIGTGHQAGLQVDIEGTRFRPLHRVHLLEITGRFASRGLTLVLIMITLTKTQNMGVFPQL